MGARQSQFGVIYEIRAGVSLERKFITGTRLKGLFGVWKESLQTCELQGVVYNLTGKYVELLTNVWQEEEVLIDWESSVVCRIKYLATEDDGILKKNGEVYDDDRWVWIGEQHIELLDDVNSAGDVWTFSYEQRKSIITPALHVGVIPLEKKILVNGYVFQKFEGELKSYDTEENIKFGNDFKATLQLGWCLSKEGELITRKGRLVIGWKFMDERTIRIEPYEYFPGDEYILKYSGVWDWIEYSGIEVWERHSNTGSGYSEWLQVEFGQELDNYHYFQLKLCFKKGLVVGSIRVRSLVIQVV